MPTLKLVGITSFCVAGEVVQPDENGLAVVSDAVMADPEFARMRSGLQDGQSIAAPDAKEEAGKPAETPKKGKR